MSLGFSAKFIRKIEKLEPDLRDVLFAFIDELEMQRLESVNKEDFRELKGIVKDLAEAQKRTEKKIEELAEAQKRTEKRVEELAEAQKRTEKRVEELAEAQKRTEKKVEELAEAQKQTEKEIKTLIKEHKETREQLGGLAMGFGYQLEDLAYKKLPGLLEKDPGITIKDGLKRTYLKDNEGEFIEVNIFGKGEKQGKVVTIIGEAKAQLSKKKVDEFLRKKIKRLDGLYENVFKIIVTYMITSPDVEVYVKEKEIALYYSYNL
jgi:DNA repair exonuclease SbcCD ATPase subunit